MVAQSNGATTAMFVCMAILLTISLGFAIATGISASKHGMNPVGWGTLTFFTWIIGLTIFLLVLKPKIDDVKCISCGKSIPRNHVYCPFCGNKESEENNINI